MEKLGLGLVGLGVVGLEGWGLVGLGGLVGFEGLAILEQKCGPNGCREMKNMRTRESRNHRTNYGCSMFFTDFGVSGAWEIMKI